ncbi:glycosyltransferase [Patescibacteria group bacterium]|nr:glycosyltransferase [Patescibacteria group bacterium]
MKKTNPYFSIIISTYNGSKKIEKCLISIFNQNFPKNKFEVIVVDDGSTDDITAKVANYPANLYHHEVNKGIATARNTGLSKANGKIVICIDDDCVVNQNFLNKIEKKYKDTNVMGVATNLITSNNNSLINKYFSSIWYGVATPTQKNKKTILDRILWYYQNCPWNSERNGYFDGAVMCDVPAACSSYRKELLNEIRGWDTKLINSSEDNDLSIRMINKYKGMRIVLCKEALVTHYQNLSFLRTLTREYKRCMAKRWFYRKYSLIPVIFPNPLLFLITITIFHNFLGLLIFVPYLLYPWWVFRFVKEKDISYLTFPYLQLIQEANSNLSILYAYIHE